MIYKQYLNKINKQELNKDKGLVQGLTLNAWKIKNNYLNLFLLIEKLNFLLKLITKLEVVITLLSSNIFFSRVRANNYNKHSRVYENNQGKYGKDNIFANMLDYLNNLKNNIKENLINFEKEKLNLIC